MVEDQRQAVMLMERTARFTMDKLLHALEKMVLRSLEKRKIKKIEKKTRVESGENTYERLNEQRQNLNRFELNPVIANREINLNKFKSWLEERDVEFAIKDMKDGSKMLVFNYRDTDLVREQLKKIISEIKKNPEKVAHDLKQTKANQPFEERMKEASIKQRDDVAKAKGIKLSPDNTTVTVEDILRTEKAAMAEKRCQAAEQVQNSALEQTTLEASPKEIFEQNTQNAEMASLEAQFASMPLPPEPQSGLEPDYGEAMDHLLESGPKR